MGCLSCNNGDLLICCPGCENEDCPVAAVPPGCLVGKYKGWYVWLDCAKCIVTITTEKFDDPPKCENSDLDFEDRLPADSTFCWVGDYWLRGRRLSIWINKEECGSKNEVLLTYYEAWHPTRECEGCG